MSKLGRQRRTPERRIQDRENRANLAYVRRLIQEVDRQKLSGLSDAFLSFGESSSKAADAMAELASIGDQLGIAPDGTAEEFAKTVSQFEEAQ